MVDAGGGGRGGEWMGVGQGKGRGRGRQGTTWGWMWHRQWAWQETSARCSPLYTSSTNPERLQLLSISTHLAHEKGPFTAGAATTWSTGSLPLGV